MTYVESNYSILLRHPFLKRESTSDGDQATSHHGPRTTMKELTYFGEVVSYLRHTSPDGISRLLVLVKVIDVKTNKDVFDHTRPSSAIFQIKVANVDEILMNMNMNNRGYIFWP